MTFNDALDSPDARLEFCRQLKEIRERSGITLDAISSATKIPVFLFAALERGDLRQWPSGVFRRAYFRDYARMIGAPIAEACDAFSRLFPERDAMPPPPAPPKPVGVRQVLLDILKNGIRIRLPGNLG